MDVAVFVRYVLSSLSKKSQSFVVHKSIIITYDKVVCWKGEFLSQQLLLCA